jgi:hypothetical protein
VAGCRSSPLGEPAAMWVQFGRRFCHGDRNGIVSDLQSVAVASKCSGIPSLLIVARSFPELAR